MRNRLLAIAALLLLFLLPHSPVFADDLSNGTAVGIGIADKNIQNGDIITSTKQGYKKAFSPYDPQIFGVVSLKPAVYLSDSTAQNATPIISVGEAEVRVSSLNGPIKRGDFITSSKIAGVGEKATDNGFILGTAEEDYTSNDPKKVGLILVTLHPHFAQLSNNIARSLFSTANLGFSALQSPSGVLRYLIAGVVTMLSFFFGFRFFARASNRGVEAIGRNPLAKQAILLSVFINSAITIAIMLLGVAVSYLILVL